MLRQINEMKIKSREEHWLKDNKEDVKKVWNVFWMDWQNHVQELFNRYKSFNDNQRVLLDEYFENWDSNITEFGKKWGASPSFDFENKDNILYQQYLWTGNNYKLFEKKSQILKYKFYNAFNNYLNDEKTWKTEVNNYNKQALQMAKDEPKLS